MADKFDPSSPKPPAPKKKFSIGTAEADKEGRPDIRLGPNTHKTTTRMIEILRSDPELYQRSGVLVHVVRQLEDQPGYARGTPLVRVAPCPWLVDRVSLHGRCIAWKGEEKGWVPTQPPADRVRAVLESPDQWSGIRQLESIVESPTMRPDGTLVQDEGYDAASRCRYIPNATFPRVKDNPTQSDATLAYAHLSELFKDFPYVNESHRSATIACMITVLVRASILGSVPCWGFDASASRSGKTLQVDVISIIATGRPASRMTFPTHSGEVDEKELESVLASYAMAGVSIVPFDNIAVPFGGPALDKVVTATNEVDLRVLGKTELRRLIWRAVVIGSGNNLEFGSDMLARVLSPRLESPLENPEARADVDADVLRRNALERRPQLVADALTIVRSYVAAGSPPQQVARWGGFDAWVRRVASALIWCGAPDPMGARRGLRGDEDSTRGAQAVIVSSWSRVCEALQSPDASVSRMLGLIYPAPRGDEPPDGFDDLREAIESLTGAKAGFAPSGRRMGELLRKLKSKPMGGLKLVPEVTSGKVARWRVVPV